MQQDMHKLNYIYILAFGSNLGDRAENFRQGIMMLSSTVSFLKIGKWKNTEPLRSDAYDTSNHSDYLNFVCLVQSELEPIALYEELRDIEDLVGHNRSAKWMPRQLDVDILFAAIKTTEAFEDGIPLIVPGANHHNLFIPHADFWKRKFLIEMLAEDLNISVTSLLPHMTRESAQRNFLQ